MADNDKTVVPDGLTPLDEALSSKLIEDKVSDKKQRFNCSSCEGVECVEKDANNIHTNKELGLKLVIPAHVCTNCGSTVYEATDYRNLLQAEEDASGRPWVKVVVKNGRVSKYSVH